MQGQTLGACDWADSPAAENAERPEPRPNTGIRVLVVDNESLIRWSVRETLFDHGIDVLAAEDGRSAIKALAVSERPFDVVLLDSQLPDVVDWSLLTLIRQMSPRTAIVVMTAFGTPEVAAEARRRGACCVLRKPFELEDLAALVSALGAPERRQDPA